MEAEKSSFDAESINAWWTEDGICVEMPEDMFAELESILMKRYDIGIKEALRQFIRWTVEKPEEFKKWVKECRADGSIA